MSYTVIGACSLCGGPVVLLDHWYGTVPQRGTCQKCHAVAKPPQNVIDMEPRQRGPHRLSGRERQHLPRV
jgi:ribosomal protein S27AE